MKRLQNYVIGVTLLLAAVLLLVWFFPARWAQPWIEPRLHGWHLEQVKGLLWDGHAARVVSVDGNDLGQLSWKLSRRALLGSVQLQADVEGPKFGMSGSVSRLSADSSEWRDVAFRSELEALPLPVDIRVGQPRGDVQFSMRHALLQGGWPAQLQLDGEWSHAVLATRFGDVALGSVRGEANGQGGVINAHVHDDGSGPLQINAQIQLSPLGWRLDAILHPRQTNPMLIRWLNRLGQPDVDGTIHLQRSGGMAMSLPTTLQKSTQGSP